jgi:uncharacterized membrane protein
MSMLSGYGSRHDNAIFPHILHPCSGGACVILAVVGSSVLTAFKVLHILSAIYFGIGVILATIFTLQVPNTPTLPAKARVMAQSSRVVLTMLVPGALLAGLFGFILAFQEYSHPFSQKWILFSTILFVISFIIGGATGPMSARTRRFVAREARSPKPSPAAYRAANSFVPIIFAGINFAIALALVYLMFAQPN